MSFSSFAVLLLLGGLCATANAHFHSIEPTSYFGAWACDRCAKACPPLKDARGAVKPVATWKRGQKVSTAYARNNHNGGFMRWSLVPFEHMYSEAWHAKNAFEHGCWESDIEPCGKTDCGSDKTGRRFRRKFVVPAVYPDGTYVLGAVWYGGLFYDRSKSYFPDYNTCVIVKIKGGVPLEKSYTPKFVPGVSSRDDVPKGVCLSTSTAVRECKGEPCPGKAKLVTPAGFGKGEKPTPILSSSMTKGAAISSKIDIGICGSGVCCKTSCGTCGGASCSANDVDGSGENCCIGIILASKKVCSNTVGAPCIED